MKKMILLCTLLVSASIQLQAGIKEKTAGYFVKQKVKSTWGTLAQKYAISLFAGSVIGGAVGIANSYLDRFTPCTLIPIGWSMWWLIRNEVTDTIMHDLSDDHVPHKKRLIQYSAWAVSWFAYLAHSSYAYGQPYMVREFKRRY